jgi:hypothetical protein
MWQSGFWATNFWSQGFWFGDDENPDNNFDDLPVRRKRRKPARENDEALILFVL